MKKCIFWVFVIIGLLTFNREMLGQDQAKESFNLVHWNILKSTYAINEYLSKHNFSIKEIQDDVIFQKLLTKTFTPDAYVVLIDQDSTLLIHPRRELIGKKLSSRLDFKEAFNVVKKAIDNETCSRGFYVWIDHEEKYLVACPLVNTTKDGRKIFYVYTMYTRSMPAYYVETLKKSKLD